MIDWEKMMTYWVQDDDDDNIYNVITMITMMTYWGQNCRGNNFKVGHPLVPLSRVTTSETFFHQDEKSHLSPKLFSLGWEWNLNPYNSYCRQREPLVGCLSELKLRKLMEREGFVDRHIGIGRQGSPTTNFELRYLLFDVGTVNSDIWWLRCELETQIF